MWRQGRGTIELLDEGGRAPAVRMAVVPRKRHCGRRSLCEDVKTQQVRVCGFELAEEAFCLEITLVERCLPSRNDWSWESHASELFAIFG